MARPITYKSLVVQGLVLSKDSIIYWASFLDTEGHIEIGYYKPSKASRWGGYNCFINIMQKTDTPAEFYGELLTHYESKIIEPMPKLYPGNFRWCPSTLGTINFLTDVLPYLRIKKRQAELCLALLERRHIHSGRGLTEEEIGIRNEIVKEYNEISDLNKGRQIIYRLVKSSIV